MQILSEDILDIKKSISEVIEKMNLLEGEVDAFASRREFKILDRYVNFWQPVDFVTRKEVNDFLRKKFKEMKNK
jgi:hypothetical protein